LSTATPQALECATVKQEGQSVKERRGTSWPVRLLLIAAGAIGGLFLCEGALLLLHAPTRAHEQITNPPNYRMDVDTIEFQYLWETNSQGLRYDEIPFRKPPGTRRILVLGDSYTDGEGVRTQERFTSRLEQAFSSAGEPVQFVNAGLGGQSVLQYARIFHWVGLRYEADAVMICIHANDIYETSPDSGPQDILSIERRPDTRAAALFYRLWPRLWSKLDLLGRQLSAPDPFTPESVDLDAVAAQARRIGRTEREIAEWRSRIRDEWVEAASRGRLAGYLLSWGLLAPDFYRQSVDLEGPLARRKWEAMSRTLEALTSEARAAGLEVAIVYIPSAYLYDARFHDPAFESAFHYLGGETRTQWLDEPTRAQRELARWSAERGIPFLDPTPALAAKSAATLLDYPLDSHWNAEGHRVAAETIERWLRQESVFTSLN